MWVDTALGEFEKMLRSKLNHLILFFIQFFFKSFIKLIKLSVSKFPLRDILSINPADLDLHFTDLI